MKKFIAAVLCLSMLAGISCEGQRNNLKQNYRSAEFKDYWYAGKAEVNSYRLIQSRYGEQRNGTAVLIFVTEDFSKKKHVKLDNPDEANHDKVNVLKLNFIKKFITGIYPYSMMQSIFTPVVRDGFDHTLKATMSTQEWCGQVFMQLNLSDDQYKVKSFSYFEEEGDKSSNIAKAFMEDEIWNVIRLDHDALPEGNIKIIPALFHSRLDHLETNPYSAVASKTMDQNNVSYTVDISELKRKITIRYEKNFPHRILAWEEEFEERGRKQRTSATLDKTLITDYWTKNGNEFQYLRDSLNLPVH
jgi:hypothetical protein